MDTRIALSGANPDVYGALMRGWQGAEMRIQDVNAQQDRTRLRGALVGRYGENMGALMEQAPHALQYEQNQAQYQAEQQKYGQEQRLQALPAIAGISEQLLQIESPEERAAAIAGYMPQLEQTLGPEGAQFLAQSFADTSNEALTRNVQLASMSMPADPDLIGLSPEDQVKARRIRSGLDPRSEPAQTTPEAVGDAFTGEDGFEYVMRQMPSGDIVPFNTGIKKRQETAPHVGKAITAASDEWQKSMVDAEQAEALAAQFERDNPPGGVGGQASEAVKGFFGTEDGISELRYRWISMRNSRVLELLPPGAASETDVQRVQAGFPDDFTNPVVVAEFLQSMANISRVKAEYDRFKADYLSKNQGPEGMLEAWYKIRPKQGKEGVETAKQRAARLGIK